MPVRGMIHAGGGAFSPIPNFAGVMGSKKHPA